MRAALLGIVGCGCLLGPNGALASDLVPVPLRMSLSAPALQRVQRAYLDAGGRQRSGGVEMVTWQRQGRSKTKREVRMQFFRETSPTQFPAACRRFGLVDFWSGAVLIERQAIRPQNYVPMPQPVAEVVVVPAIFQLDRRNKMHASGLWVEAAFDPNTQQPVIAEQVAALKRRVGGVETILNGVNRRDRHVHFEGSTYDSIAHLVNDLAQMPDVSSVRFPLQYAVD